MKNSKQIFDYIQGMNATSSEISSMGSFVSSMNEQVAQSVVTEILTFLSNDDKKDTLAYKIASTAFRFTDKQLWVIAFELVKNEDFANEVASFYANLEKESKAKQQASKDKLTANKTASLDILAPVKELKRLVEFGKWLNTSGNKFRKEHFSKKYTQESVNKFLAI